MNTRKLFFLVVLILSSVLLQAQSSIDLLILNKSYEKALVEIDKSLEMNPSVDLCLKKSGVLNQLQQYTNSLNCLMQALELDANNSQVMLELAEGLSILGNYQDAENYFSTVFEKDTTQLSVGAKLGRVYINLKQHKNGYDIFSCIYGQDSTNVYWNKQYAYCAHRIGKRELASKLYESVIRDNPRDKGSYINLIHTYKPSKEGNKILETIAQGLEQFPNDPDISLELANYYFRVKRYAEANMAFDSYFQQVKHSSYDIKLNHGICKYFSQDPQKAYDYFMALFTDVPNDPILMYYISLCHKKLKNYEESEKMMTWAIEGSTPDYVSEMYHHLGQIYGQQRKFDESIQAMEKAYELNPTKHEILFEIATTYEEYNSNKTLALNYYRIYLKEVGEDGENINYALTRINRLKEDLFFEE